MPGSPAPKRRRVAVAMARAADVHDSEAREIRRLEARDADDELDHRGHEERRHGAVAFDRVDPTLRVEAREEPPAEPAAHRSADQERTAGGGEGRGGEEPQPEPGRWDSVGGREPAVAHDHALRLARGPRGVHDVGDVVGCERLLQVTVIGGEEPYPTAARGADDGRNGGEQFVVHLSAQQDRSARMTQDPRLLGGTEPGQEWHRYRPGLVDGHVRHEPFERLVAADEEPHPVGVLEPVLPQAPREAVGAPVPLVEGDGGAVGQVLPRHAVGACDGQLGQQLRLQQRHAGGTRGIISRGRRPQGWHAGCRPAWS